MYVWDEDTQDWVEDPEYTSETADTGLTAPTYWDQVTSDLSNISWNDVKRLFSGTSPFGVPGQIAGLGGVGYLLNKLLGGGGGGSGFASYQGGIPSLTASRQMLPIPQTVTTPEGKTVPRRPGSGGITYFSPMVYSAAPTTPPGVSPPAPPAKVSDDKTGGSGNIPPMTPPVDPDAGPPGGIQHTPPAVGESTSSLARGGITSLAKGGRFLRGPGDGVSDSIPAKFAETGKPAALADGEFVLDARTVSEIGNGSSEAGARKLYAFMKAVHGARKKAGRGSKSSADKHLNKLLA